MEINSATVVKILNQKFGYPIVKTKIGEGVCVDSRIAFLYSIVTGPGYLDNPLYPFTAKGLMKVFYTAMDYKFVTGLFDNTTLKNTPYILSKAKPYLFNGKKIILPIEFNTENEKNYYRTNRRAVLFPEREGPCSSKAKEILFNRVDHKRFNRSRSVELD